MSRNYGYPLYENPLNLSFDLSRDLNHVPSLTILEKTVFAERENSLDQISTLGEI